MILTISNLHIRYGAIEALHGISLTVPRGQIVCLIGANGAGKTTLLRAISALIPVASGEILYAPTPASDAPSSSRSSFRVPRSAFSPLPLHRTPPHRIVAAGLSHVPEGRGIFPNMTVAENLELGAYLRRDGAEGGALAKDRDRVFALFPRIKERRSQLAGTLSGGEQQMLAIGRALMSRPTMLLLDEPSLGLAPLLVEQIFRTIREINAQGVTVLLVEQNAHMALQTAHYAYVLETGRLALEGPAHQVATNDQVRKAYLGED